MTKTFSVTVTDGVADIDGRVVDGLESVRQRITQALRFWRGTWFRDQDAGVPWLPDLLGRPGGLGLITSAITARIATVADVTGVEDVDTSFDAATRILSYRARAHTVYGDTDIVEDMA